MLQTSNIKVRHILPLVFGYVKSVHACRRSPKFSMISTCHKYILTFYRAHCEKTLADWHRHLLNYLKLFFSIFQAFLEQLSTRGRFMPTISNLKKRMIVNLYSYPELIIEAFVQLDNWRFWMPAYFQNVLFHSFSIEYIREVSGCLPDW